MIYRGLTVDHVLDLTGRKLAERVADGDVGTAARGLLRSSDLEDTVDINFENNLEHRLTSPHGRDRCESELAQRGVILAVDTLALVHRELNSLLIIGNSGKGPMQVSMDGCGLCWRILGFGIWGSKFTKHKPLFNSWHCVSTRNDRSEDVALHSDTE